MKVALLIFGILTVISLIGGATFGVYFFGIITVLLLIGYIYNSKQKKPASGEEPVTNYQGYSNTNLYSGSAVSDSEYGMLLIGSKHIASFKNGVVYIPAYGSPAGYYDDNGNVFNNKRELIGAVRDHRIILDRTKAFKQFQDSSFLKGDPDLYRKSRLPGFQPPLQLEMARHQYSYISSVFDDEIDCYIEKCKTDSDEMNRIGSCAAYIVLIEDRRLHPEYHEFYAPISVQEDFFLHVKDPNLKNYSPFFSKKYNGIIVR